MVKGLIKISPLTKALIAKSVTTGIVNGILVGAASSWPEIVKGIINTREYVRMRDYEKSPIYENEGRFWKDGMEYKTR